MPYKDKELQREFNRLWVAKRRAAWFEGKVCAKCGSVDSLELDHVDPSTKVSHSIWSWSEERRLLELAKCQPLCYDCHKNKTIIQISKPDTHGTVNYYMTYGCRCPLCTDAASLKRELQRFKSGRTKGNQNRIYRIEEFKNTASTS